MRKENNEEQVLDVIHIQIMWKNDISIYSNLIVKNTEHFKHVKTC